MRRHANRLKKRDRAAKPRNVSRAPAALIGQNQDSVDFDAGGKKVRLTNLDKVFWPDLGITKRDLLQYYIDLAPVLLPHLADRAMVMKRYPNGIARKEWRYEERQARLEKFFAKNLADDPIFQRRSVAEQNSLNKNARGPYE